MSSRITSGKLLALGTVIDGAGAVAIAIWQVNPHSFTPLLGFWIAVAAFVVGFLLVLAGIYTRDGGGAPPSQSQHGGDQSTLYQAGRDIRVERGEGHHG
jgi:hypothetical protein